ATVIAASIVAGFALGGGDDRLIAPAAKPVVETRPQVPLPPPPPPPPVPTLPAAPLTRTIELAGLPDTAVVRLDDQIVDGHAPVVPLDGHPHKLTITAPGFDPDAHELDAASPATLTIKLHRKRPPRPVAPPPPPPPSHPGSAYQPIGI